MTMHKFTENCQPTVGIPSQNITAAEKAGTGVDMAKYRNFAAIVSQKAATQYLGDITCVIAESTDNSTFSNTYLATTTISSNTATDQVSTVECRADQMTAGYRYLRVEITPAAGTVNPVAAMNVRFNPRFPQASLAA